MPHPDNKEDVNMGSKAPDPCPPKVEPAQRPPLPPPPPPKRHPSTHGNTTAEHVAACRKIGEQAANAMYRLGEKTRDVINERIMESLMTTNSNFENTLQTIASLDVKTLMKKDAEYGSSWKKRGGVGAFMMLARKWDRIEVQCTRPSLDSKYDIFDAIEQDEGTIIPPPGKAIATNPTTESTLETIRDLRRYLLLVESEIVLRKQVDNYGTGPAYPPGFVHNSSLTQSDSGVAATKARSQKLDV